MAGLEYKVFHGVGAVIAEVKSDTLFSVIAVLTDDRFVDFSNTDLRFSVDMSRTPSHIRRLTDWAKVLIDDRGVDAHGKELPLDAQPRFPLAITSIGGGSSDDPARGAFAGAVYLERDYYLSLRNTKLSGWPDNPGDYTLLQLTSVAYSSSSRNGKRASKRYHGFPATVTGIDGSSVTVEITERDDTHEVTFAADDSGAYDPDPPAEALDGELSLATNLKVGESGALFLELATAVSAQLRAPKIPIGEGD